MIVDLSTNYLGLKLNNPIIVGSSGLTDSVEKIKKAAEAGAGAVVLKSLFEEQILYNIHEAKKDSYTPVYPEADDYISNYTQTQQVEQYLNLISEARKAVDIPVIASINCISNHEWTSFAKKIEDAGASALELNLFILPSDHRQEGKDIEKLYIDIINKVKLHTSLPIAAKMSYYFSGLANFATRLSWTGIKGLVLFNRFYSPDIDIDHFSLKATNVFSTPEELPVSLRWVAILSDVVQCDIAASTGVHDGTAVVKQLLAGAKVIMTSTSLYKNGLGQIAYMKEQMSQWMMEKGFNSIDDFRGKMSFKQAENPAAYQRVQFMKHFSGIE